MGTNVPGDFEQQVLLAVWRLDDRAYGAAVRDLIEARAGRSVAHGAVYVTLVRLEKKGLLRSHLSDPTPVRGGKAKRYFVIQPEVAGAHWSEFDRLGEFVDCGREAALEALPSLREQLDMRRRWIYRLQQWVQGVV